MNIVYVTLYPESPNSPSQTPPHVASMGEYVAAMN